MNSGHTCKIQLKDGSELLSPIAAHQSPTLPCQRVHSRCLSALDLLNCTLVSVDAVVHATVRVVGLLGLVCEVRLLV